MTVYYNLSKKTIEKIKKYKDLGYEIIIGNNPKLPQSKKYNNCECIRLCLTNSRYHGWSIRTVWAVKKITN
jgi:hypothetical protein